MSTTQLCRYGDYSFPFQTVAFNSALLYNDAGTLIATQYDITVTGVVYADEGDTTLAEAIKRMQYYLHRPRQFLKLAWTPDGGSQQTLFAIGDETTEDENIRHPDIDYGPMPQGLRIAEITGGLAAEYEWRITCRTKEVMLANGTNDISSRSMLLAVTRAFTFNVDQDGMTERVVAGKLTVGRNSLAAKQGPSYYRDYVYPPLPDGFHRSRQTFDVDQTGLSATFTVVDREQAHVAPPPLTTSRATISANTPLRGGKITFTLSGEFAAPKNVSKGLILNAISSLVRSRITPQSIMESRELSSDLYDRNSISFRFTWWEVKIVPLAGAGQVTNQATAPLIAPPPGGVKSASYAAPHGTAGLTEYMLKTPYDAGVNKLSSLKQQLAGRKSNLPGTQVSQQPAPPAVPIPEPASDVSKLCQQTPVIEFLQVRSYEVKNNKVVFRPKVRKAAPIIQQTAPPNIYVIDTGVMRFVSNGFNEKMPQIPKPPSSALYDVLEAFVSPASPEPVGDGSVNAYKITWRYVCVRRLGINSDKFDNVGVEIPADIRRASSKTLPYISEVKILSV